MTNKIFVIIDEKTKSHRFLSAKLLKSKMDGIEEFEI
jgi:hypothetical protein